MSFLPKVKGCMGRNDLIPVLANILFFILVQTVFFYFVASKQYEDVLENKLEFIKTLAEENNNFNEKLQSLKEEFLKDNEEDAEKQEKLRYENNINLTKTYCGLPFLLFAGILFVLIILPKRFINRDWNDIDTLSLLFVLLAYCTELFFFFFIVKKYEFVGDQYIVSRLVRELIN